jgi:hypothetical protein
VTGEADVQLCPQAIMPEERVFPHDDAYIYGVVLKDVKDGYKSVLYSDDFGSTGVVASNRDMARTYFEEQARRGNRVRIKDPRESDGQGQLSIETTDELLSFFDEADGDDEVDHVLMPHMETIIRRVSVGRIALGKFGEFCYIGLEDTATHQGSEVYGGTELGLFNSNVTNHEKQIEEHFEIPHELVELGNTALDTYSRLAIYAGRVSVDVIEGITDSGEVLRDVIDITPRMGGTTPAEVLAVNAIHHQGDAVCFAANSLIYNPSSSPSTGVNFIDTKSLVINAEVHEVRQ